MAFIVKANRDTFAYRFSVVSKDDKDLLDFKQMIKDINKRNRYFQKQYPTRHYGQYRVSLMGRGRKRNPGSNSLVHSRAKYFDVYLYEVY